MTTDQGRIRGGNARDTEPSSPTGPPTTALPATGRASAGRCCNCRGASLGSREETAWGTARRWHLGTQQGEAGMGMGPGPF